MYTAEKDIEKIRDLMHSVQKGTVSRNKNFYILKEKKKENSLFRRAKLFLSLLNDLDSTMVIENHRIWITPQQENYEINLFNPSLRYHRKVQMSKEELNILRQTHFFEKHKSIVNRIPFLT